MSTIDRRVLPSWTGFVLWLIFYLSYKCSYKGSGGRYIISSVYCCNHRYIRHLNMSISEQKLTFAAIFRKHWCSRCHRPDGRVGVKYWLNHDVIRVKHVNFVFRAYQLLLTQFHIWFSPNTFVRQNVVCCWFSVKGR